MAKSKSSKKKKSGINIKKKNQGKFRKSVGAKKGKKLTTAQINKGLKSKNPKTRQRANFARNARKWNKGGKKK